jgi:uncharacterized membrane protein
MSDPNLPPPPGGNPPPPGGIPPGQPPRQPPPPGGGFGGPPGGPGGPPGGGFGGPPGGFSPPPAQPYGGGDMPRLDVGAALGYGWKKFSENVGQFVVLMIAVLVAGIVVSLIRAVLTPEGFGFVAFIWSLVLAAAAYVAMAIVQAGVWRAGLGVTRGESPSVSQLTETKNIGPFIITNLLVGLGFAVGLVLCVLPGFIWLLFTAYAPLLALDKGMDPVESIRTSIGWVKDNIGQVFVILLVSYIVYFIGVVACVVGLLVTIPVALIAIVYSYRALTNEPVVA